MELMGARGQRDPQGTFPRTEVLSKRGKDLEKSKFALGVVKSSGSHPRAVRRRCKSSQSHFSRVQLFVTLWIIACQAPLSMGIFQARILESVAMPSSRSVAMPSVSAPQTPRCRECGSQRSCPQGHQLESPELLLQDW